MIDVTTQLGIRRVKHPVERRFRTSQPHLRKKRLCGRFYSDTCFFKCKSIRGDTCAQITGNGKGFCRFWSMKTKSLAHEGLRNFIEMDGIPENLVVDGSKEQSHNAWKDTLRTYHVNQSTSEPYSPWQNRAESEIKMIKIGIKKFTLQCNSPRSVWCYLGELISKLRRVTPSLIPSLGGRTPYEDVMGSTPDISALIQFRWWDLVYFLDSDGDTKLARWMGPAETSGGSDAYWLLPWSCIPIVRSTVWEIPTEDLEDNMKKEIHNEFNQIVKSKLGDSRTSKGSEIDTNLSPDSWDMFGDDREDPVMEPVETEAEQPEDDNYTEETYNNYL